jgi:isopenicillin-N N-acyltransferase like protein
MKRRNFLNLCALTTLLSGCGFWRIDPWSPLIRSSRIRSREDELKILKNAQVSFLDHSNIRVLYLEGDPYEIGYQQGALLTKEIQDNLNYLYSEVKDIYYFEELFAEAYERQLPFIPKEYLAEMHGLAHGSRLSLNLIHAIHALPEMSEWGGKKEIKKTIKDMYYGNLGTSCTNIAALPNATKDNQLLAVRILDWGLHKFSKLHEYPQITVVKPKEGLRYANVGWTGFIGAVSGMNEAGITLGEMGYGDPEGESLDSMPMVFMLREILSKASTLAEARDIIKNSPIGNSYVFVISDGKAKTAKMFIKDKTRFLEFSPGENISEDGKSYKLEQSLVYGGHFDDRLQEDMKNFWGEFSLDNLKENIIPHQAMNSNFQNIIYAPSELNLWVSNAKNRDEPAHKEPYYSFNLRDALLRFATPKNS